MYKFLLPLLLLLYGLSSCTSHRKAIYFSNVKDSAQFQQASVPEALIKKTDLLSIMVSSPNREATEMFNMPNVNEAQSSAQSGEVLRTSGYIVGSDGMFRFPMLGMVRAEGLTKKQLEETIRTALIDRKLLVDPVVHIRHLNFKVTVIGEVTRPAVITVTNEKITLLEALGLAGDLTIFGKRNNIMVIREENGRATAQRINLNTTELFSSPYYYLRNDDVVYVEPNKAKTASATRFYQLLPSIISGLSTSIFILDRIIR